MREKIFPIFIIVITTLCSLIWFVTREPIADKDILYKKISETISDFNIMIKDTSSIDISTEINRASRKSKFIKIPITREKGCMVFTKNGEVNEIDQIGLIEDYDNVRKSIPKNEKIDNFSRTEYINYIIEKYIPNEYRIIENQPFLNLGHRIACLKNNEYGIKNYYDSYVFVVPYSGNTVYTFYRVDEFEMTEGPKITEEEAIKIAKDVYNNDDYTEKPFELAEVELVVKGENNNFGRSFWRSASNKKLHLVYSVISKSRDKIYVDAITGKVIGGDSEA
ncbi:hypothetical protein [Peptoniphilus indolicus]|uniref:Peptidase and YPEB domain protein n=2 Tax=Peptoniphilus indolicus TaxID=33030 RepID=G4D196_9FIRM|nr:hypothetical protein [Peptoniphilus indolicus]EGY80707.1 peptidase and YPEB domain protein [Peptoniphilus indolicus ATCC 29427]SUB74876.1 Uncharacterised protein [Peptoniphilus indolicus]